MRKIFCFAISLFAAAPLFAEVVSPTAQSAAGTPIAASATDDLAPLRLAGRFAVGLGYAGTGALSTKYWLSEKDSIGLDFSANYAQEPAPAGAISESDLSAVNYTLTASYSRVLARLGRSTFFSAGLGLQGGQQTETLHSLFAPNTFSPGRQESVSYFNVYSVGLTPNLGIEYFLPSESHLSLQAKAGFQGSWSHEYSSSQTYLNGTRTQISESYSDTWQWGLSSTDFQVGMNYYF
jgi:hypothetical protein